MGGKVIKEPVCVLCKHVREWGKCDAFPDGIPEEIMSGENLHDKPFPGDRDIQFDLMNTET